MKRIISNKFIADVGTRDKSLWTGERLDIQITREAKRLKRAQDKFEEQQLRREQESEFDIREYDV